MNHPGVQKTTKMIANRFWWPSRDQQINDYIKTCHTCQAVKPANTPTLCNLNPIETRCEPYKIWSIDTIVMGSASEQDMTPNGSTNKYILTVVDHHSRYTWATAVKNNTSEASICFLSKLFASTCKPDALLSDNGTSFTSNRFRNYLKSKNIKHLLTAPFRPQSNGICEKANDLIVKGLRLAISDNPKIHWSKALESVITSMNDRPHEITGFAPRFLQFGTVSCAEDRPIETLEQARQLSTNRSRQAQLDRKKRHDTTHQKSNFELNDLVKWRLTSKPAV